MNLLTIEKDISNGKDKPTFHTTTENTTVKVPTDKEALNWGEFKYYRDLYITNIVNTTHSIKRPIFANSSDGQYIVTEAARGPKNYLRIGSH